MPRRASGHDWTKPVWVAWSYLKHLSKGTNMTQSERRRKRRAWMLFVYPFMWLLTFLGAWGTEPQLFGIPLWYLWTGTIMLLLVPVNFLFARYCWPLEREEEPRV